MSKNHKNEISEENLQDVSGGIDLGHIFGTQKIGMANPFDTPEKKQAYQDFKDGKIDRAKLAQTLGIKLPKFPGIK